MKKKRSSRKRKVLFLLDGKISIFFNFLVDLEVGKCLIGVLESGVRGIFFNVYWS